MSGHPYNPRRHGILATATPLAAMALTLATAPPLAAMVLTLAVAMKESGIREREMSRCTEPRGRGRGGARGRGRD